MATNIFTGQKNVTTSGTPVQLATQSVESDQIVLLKAKSANTGFITVGDTSAHALNSGAGFYKLAAGQSIEIRCTNTNLIWIDATVNGEGIEYFVGASGGGASTSSGISGAVSSVAGFFDNIPFAQYVSSAATITANYFTNLYTTINGFLKTSFGDLLGGEDLTNNVMGIVRKPLAISTYAPSRSVAVENDVDVSAKAAAGNVFACGGYNKNGSTRYFQIFNKASAPAGSDVPVYSFPVATGARFEIGESIFGESGQNFSTGIAWGWSTASGSFTAATTTDHYGFVHYV